MPTKRSLKHHLALLVCALTLGATNPMHAQPASELARELAPTGKLRVGLLMLSYFAVEDAAAGEPNGVMPDLGRELARRIGVPYEPVRIRNPGEMIEGFRSGKLDATFIGITADRAAVFDFGPVIIGIRTTFLVPAASPIKAIEEIDQAGVRIVVPQRSAQEAHLKKIISKASMIPVAVETPKPAIELLAAGQADAFSHVVPMLESARPSLPGSRILPGSYYDVPVAIGYAKGRSAAAVAFYKTLVEEMKASGFAQKAIDRMGAAANGLIVLTQQ
jgi:polar amino acid transport system substrate-binding protein